MAQLGGDPSLQRGMSARLAGTLAAVRDAGLLAVDRKAAVRRAIELEMGMVEEPSSRRAVDHEYELEVALNSIARCAGSARIGIGQAKSWLRTKGKSGHALASELGNLSSMRNRQAHPVVGYAARLDAFLEQQSDGDAPPGGTDVVSRLDAIESRLVRLEAIREGDLLHSLLVRIGDLEQAACVGQVSDALDFWHSSKDVADARAEMNNYIGARPELQRHLSVQSGDDSTAPGDPDGDAGPAGVSIEMAAGDTMKVPIADDIMEGSFTGSGEPMGKDDQCSSIDSVGLTEEIMPRRARWCDLESDVGTEDQDSIVVAVSARRRLQAHVSDVSTADTEASADSGCTEAEADRVLHGATHMRHLSSVVYEVISSAAVASKAIVGEDERKSWADISSDSDADAPGTSLSSGLKTSDVLDDVRLDDMPSCAASEALSTFTAAVTSGEIVRAGAMTERGEEANSDVEENDDPALGTYLCSLEAAFLDDPVDVDSIKKHYAIFLRARLAQGIARSTARQAAMSIVRDFKAARVAATQGR